MVTKICQILGFTWVNNTKQSKLDISNKILDNFIQSDDIYLNYKHLKMEIK